MHARVRCSVRAHTTTYLPACSRVWSAGLSVSRIDRDMSNSCVSFCLPKATAPLVTMMHSRPSFWHSATCSTMEAKRPRARPCSSSLVITALPSLTTNRRAYFSWLRSLKVVARRGLSEVCSSLRSSTRLPFEKRQMKSNETQAKSSLSFSVGRTYPTKRLSFFRRELEKLPLESSRRPIRDVLGFRGRYSCPTPRTWKSYLFILSRTIYQPRR